MYLEFLILACTIYILAPSIVIKKLGLYYAQYVDKDNVSDILNDGYTDGSNELVVPEVKSIDDMKNKRWHSIAILSKDK